MNSDLGIPLPQPYLPTLNLGESNFTLLSILNPLVIWVIVLVVGLIALVMTIILRWHWKKYSLHTATEKRMTRLYYVGIGIGSIAIIAGALLYTSIYTNI